MHGQEGGTRDRSRRWFDLDSPGQVPFQLSRVRSHGRGSCGPPKSRTSVMTRSGVMWAYGTLCRQVVMHSRSLYNLSPVEALIAWLAPRLSPRLLRVQLPMARLSFMNWVTRIDGSRCYHQGPVPLLSGPCVGSSWWTLDIGVPRSQRGVPRSNFICSPLAQSSEDLVVTRAYLPWRTAASPYGGVLCLAATQKVRWKLIDLFQRPAQASTVRIHEAELTDFEPSGWHSALLSSSFFFSSQILFLLAWIIRKVVATDSSAPVEPTTLLVCLPSLAVTRYIASPDFRHYSS